MKKTFPILMILGLALSGTATVFALNNSIPNQVNAYSASSLPTTIKLNDNTEMEIRNYYSSLNSLSASERQGNNLLKNLKEVLKNGQKYYSYDSGNAVWQIYEIADRDWVKSPASSISKSGTYNASNNTITGYKYSTNSNYSSYDNPYVHALYVNRNGDNPMRAWGDHSQGEGGINREHIWPKSRGFDTEAKGGARGDPMHLWAADGKTNNVHSNWAYGYVDTKKSFTDVGATCNYTTYSLHGNYKGTSKTLKSGTVFEPQDSDKGDIARACFYMAARYNNWAGATSGIDSDDPNLTIENVTWGSGDTGTSTYNNSFSMGILSDLLEWNRLDPVDQYEIHRNNLLYNNYTNNRNPFIDFPQWADYIWGDPDNIGTPTGAADPSKNSINAKEPDPSTSSSESSSSQPSSEFSSSEIPSSESSSSEIPSSSESSSQPSSSDSSQSSESSSSIFIEPALELSTTSLNLKPGESAKVSGISSDGSAIEWSTSDESIVSISAVGPVSSRQEVTITALKEGKATITASCDFPSGQNISKFIDIVVKEEAVPSSSSSTPASSSPESSQPPVSSSSSKQDFFSFFGCNSSISAFGIGGIAIIGAIASFVLFKKKKD